MRILHVITLSELGGAQSVVYNLVNEHSKKHEVHIISGGNGNAWEGLKRVKIHLVKDLYRNISLKDIAVLNELRKLKKVINPDIIHLHSSKMGVLGRLVFDTKKIVYTVHGFDSILVANKKFLFVEKLLKNRAYKIIGVSKYDEVNLKKEGIVSNVKCIYNGIEDISEKTNLTYNPDILNKFDSIRQKYKFIVCCIARDNQQKKIDLFIEVAKQMPDIAFVWMGNDNSYTKLSDNIFLFGKVSTAAFYLKYMDLFILPSNYEGLPMSIIEALSMSLPVVASDVGGISELIDGTNGFTSENKVEDFASKINKILSDPVIYNSMSKKARETYENKFTLKMMADNYEKVYNEINSKNE
ncbi:MAG: glycosyltransferase [Bacteroidales bacterium]|nr:glycosyltransferase [Bacteroidales bacterium]